jgi:hypothetical protein
MKLEFSGQIYKIALKFHENPSSASHVIPYGKTDMTKLTVPF